MANTSFLDSFAKIPFIKKVILPETSTYNINGENLSKIFSYFIKSSTFYEDGLYKETDVFLFGKAAEYAEYPIIIDTFPNDNDNIRDEAEQSLSAEQRKFYQKNKLRWTNIHNTTHLLIDVYPEITGECHVFNDMHRIHMFVSKKYRQNEPPLEDKKALCDEVSILLFHMATIMIK